MSKAKNSVKKAALVGEAASKVQGSSNYESNSKVKGKYQKQGDVKKAVASAEGGLEQRLNTGAENSEGLLSKLVSKGMSEKQARQFLKQMQSMPDYKNYSHDWKTNLSDYLKAVKNYKGLMNWGDFVKGAYYLFMTLTAVENVNRDPFEDVKDTKYIFIPGYLQMPQNVDKLEQNSGIKMAYCRTNNLDAIHELVSKAAEYHGSVVLMGFSDGEKTLTKYFEAHDSPKVEKYVPIAGNPVDNRKYGGKFVQVRGSFDMLAPMEQSYDGFLTGKVDSLTYKGGHTWLFHEKQSGKDLGGILRTIGPKRGYNIQRYDEMREAA